MLRVANIKNAVALAASLNTTDSRVYDYLNKAVRQCLALPDGRWEGSQQQLRICVKERCITWPRIIKSIEGFSLCGCPGIINNKWFEFIEAGTGFLANCTRGTYLQPRGTAPMFDDLSGTGNQLRVYCQDAADVGKTIKFYGYDDNQRWQNETVTLVTTGSPAVTVSATFWNSVARVVKDATTDIVLVYEWDGTDERGPLAIYEADETDPEYIRSFVPNVSTTTDTAIDVVANLRHINVSKDDDVVILNSEDAIETMVRSIRLKEQGDWGGARLAKIEALEILQAERSRADGAESTQFQLSPGGVWGAGGLN